MSEKLTESITHKCSDEEKRKLEAIARTRKLSLSELIRSICIREIQDVEELLNSLQNAFALTTDTVDTPFFELAPEPLLKQTGTKKAQLCDQLSLIATPMN